MLMKTIPAVLIAGAGMWFTAPVASAQQATGTAARLSDPGPVSDSDIDLMRKDLRAQKKQIVAMNLPLTPDEAVKFWPIYEQYTAETIKVNDRRFGLVKQYAAAYNTMTDAQAGTFIKDWIATDQDATRLRLTYIPIFEKVLPAKKVAMFFQIDRRLGLMIELQLASQSPLVSASN